MGVRFFFAVRITIDDRSLAEGWYYVSLEGPSFEQGSRDGRLSATELKRDMKSVHSSCDDNMKRQADYEAKEE